MGAGADLARDQIGRIDPERLGAPHVGSERIAVGQHEPRHSIGERRLADSGRPADQPCMRNSSAAIGIQQRHLGVAVPKQRAGLARVNGGDPGFDLAGAHAGLATSPALVANNRSRKAAQMVEATMPGSAVASIKTQRCGSLAAICR